MEWVFIGFQIGLGILASLAFSVAAIGSLKYIFEEMGFFEGMIATVLLVFFGGSLIFHDEMKAILVYLQIANP